MAPHPLSSSPFVRTARNPRASYHVASTRSAIAIFAPVARLTHSLVWTALLVSCVSGAPLNSTASVEDDFAEYTDIFSIMIDRTEEVHHASNDPSVDKSHSVLVQTQFGPIEGFVHTTGDGDKGNIFLGIPFAQPPVGELRFERPVPPVNWSEPLSAKDFKDSCVPYTKSWIQNEPFSEDCLYLNVMAPTHGHKLPVLVYIHGGGFAFGDVVKCGFDKITHNFVRRDIVLVTVPYRVGIYGFFSMGTAGTEGNYGLWDQTEALKFVKHNIEQFGGDPDNITIWGQSAGSASVDALTLSPHSRDLFHKVVQGSGSMMNSWAISAPLHWICRKMAHETGCTSDDPEAIKAHLKTLPFQDILEVSSTKFTDDTSKPERLAFSVTLNSTFFDNKTIEQLIAEAPPKPTLFGLMSQEAAPFLIVKDASVMATYSADIIVKSIRERLVKPSDAGEEAAALQEELIDYFVKPVQDSKDPRTFLNAHADLTSDIMFNQGVLDEMQHKLESGWPLYMYVFDHLSDSVRKILPFNGSFHSYELAYVFDQVVFPFDVHGPPEKLVQELYVDLLSQFAKTGNPSTPTLKIPAYTAAERASVWINVEPSIRADPFGARRKFWQDLKHKYHCDLVRGRVKMEL